MRLFGVAIISMSNYVINVLSESDWREYKSIRLKSLEDSPDSFGSTYQREALFTPEKWKSRLQVSPNIEDAVALAAVADQEFIGLVSAVIHQGDTSSANLYQMWVAAEYRGRGVGTALVDGIKSWAINKGIINLQLSVTTTNLAAVALYESIGFCRVGSLEPLREGSDLSSQPMEMKLASREA